jgi:hypothetical protein
MVIARRIRLFVVMRMVNAAMRIVFARAIGMIVGMEMVNAATRMIFV